MNRIDMSGQKEATIRYLDGDYQVLSPGSHVTCAVTGETILIDDLKYWSVARQEAYRDVEASLERELEMNPQLRKR